jgi:predicted RNase H-like HicB family nuclease
MNKIEMIVECTSTGYSSYAVKYPVATTGKDLHHLKKNILEALNLYFEKDSKIISEENIKINIDLPQFFEHYKVINVEALSERIGMNQNLLLEYIKGVKKPSSSQTEKILKGIQKIGVELSELSFLL